jgi:hypothetical protein
MSISGCPRQIDGLEINEAEDGFIIYDPDRDSVHFLNHTAVFMLELCNGKHGPAEIISIFSEAYGLKAPPEKDLLNILEKFIEEGLVRL